MNERTASARIAIDAAGRARPVARILTSLRQEAFGFGCRRLRGGTVFDPDRQQAGEITELVNNPDIDEPAV